MPEAEPINYSSLFFIGEQLNDTTEAKRYTRGNIAKNHKTLRSIWNRWSDVSVPEIKAFLGLTINLVLLLLLLA
jgi:hypothetical protein